MLFLELFAVVFLSQFLVYIFCKFKKVSINKWVSLFYLLVNVVAGFTYGNIILFVVSFSTIDNGEQGTANFYTLLFFMVTVFYFWLLVRSFGNVLTSFSKKEKTTA